MDKTINAHLAHDKDGEPTLSLQVDGQYIVPTYEQINLSFKNDEYTRSRLVDILDFYQRYYELYT